jgi:hypothetical protein
MRSELRGLRFEVSHPCYGKNSQGWGTGGVGLARRATAGPSTPLRFAQDDSHCLYVQGGNR